MTGDNGSGRHAADEPGEADDAASEASAGDVSPSPADAVSRSSADADEVPEPTDTDDPALGPPARERRGARRRRERAEKRRKAPWWELPALVLLAVGIAIVVKSFVVQPFYIPSDSMEKTLHGCPGCRGDRILVNKVLLHFRAPHPGDIVVFHDPTDWASSEPISRPPSNPVLRTVRGFGQLIGFVPPDGQVLVKRVIAVGGETVKGDRQGRVSISTHGPGGPYRTLNEPYVYAPAYQRQALVPFGPVTIPQGRLWVMGDHRTDSADSRYHCTPDGQGTSDDSDCNATSSTVPVGNVIGKAFVIAWPPSRWRTLGTPATFTSAAEAGGPSLPTLLSGAVIVPVVLVRRRRRR